MCTQKKKKRKKKRWNEETGNFFQIRIMKKNTVALKKLTEADIW
jgi:hypothetical protein